MVDTNTAYPVHAQSAAQHAAILERFEAEPVRFLVYTTVIDDGVPDPIKKHLFGNYAPFWGNIWIYAPQSKPTDSKISLLFTATYAVETEQPRTVQIDGQSYAPGETVELRQGQHAIVTPVRLRLKLQPPNIDHLLNPAYREPIAFFWPNMGPAADHVRAGVWLDD
jgi:hypothetical protein